jgi:hypothetical protein
MARAIVIACAVAAVGVAAYSSLHHAASAGRGAAGSYAYGLLVRYAYSPNQEQLLVPLIRQFNAERHLSGGRARRELNDRRGRFLPPGYFSPTDTDDRNRAAIEEKALGQLDEQAQELAVEVEQLWEKAAGLQDVAGRLAGEDEEIEQEIAALEQRKMQLDSVHRNRHAEDAHEAVDGLLAFHRERLDAMLDAASIGPREVQEIIAVWSVRDPELAEALHEVVDRRTDFAPGTRDDYRKQAELIARQIGRRKAELDLRIEERAVAEAEVERAAAEARLAAVEA